MDIYIQQNPWLAELCVGFLGLTAGYIIMLVIGALFIWLGFKKAANPFLLAAGVGIILVNIPFSGVISQIPGEEGFLLTLHQLGILNEMLPVLILVMIGMNCDFSLLLRRPSLIALVIGSQLGIILVAALASSAGFGLRSAAAIGMTSVADGATAIFVASRYAREWLGLLGVAAFSFGFLLPIVGPPLAKALISADERKIVMKNEWQKPVAVRTKVFFSLGIMIFFSLLLPRASSLVASLMFGNLLKETAVWAKPRGEAKNALSAIAAVLTGLCVGGMMQAQTVLTAEAGLIVLFGLIGLVFNIASGIAAVKLYNIVSRKKINPVLGACMVAAYPLPAKAMADLAEAATAENDLEYYACGINAAGQLAAVVAGGLALLVVAIMLK